MKKRTLFGVSLLAMLILISAGFNISSDSNSLDVKDNIPVDEFSSVGISVSASVYLEQGNTHSLEIDASEKVLEEIEVEVKNGKLLIKPEDYKTKFREEINIYIVSPEYESVELAGSGKVIAEGKMNLDDVVLKIAGSGYMKFDELSADEVEIKMSGSGSMDLKGTGSEELSVSIAGSGNMNAENFQVDEFDAKISGSGSCKVYVTGELDASIAGSGSIYYKGSPQVESSVAGSGKVKKL
ncbi:MAG: head GIN domain-containing protein [Bacteroidales bacterium]